MTPSSGTFRYNRSWLGRTGPLPERRRSAVEESLGNAMVLFFKNLLFTVLMPGTVAVYAPLLIARGHAAASVAAWVLALPAFVLGGAIYVWCVWDFATFGRGTPLPLDAPKRLVVRGLYRYTRNPMYVGVLTVLSGWVLLFQTAALVGYAVLVGMVFHLFVVGYEEPRLRQLFGEEYDAYRARVGRWLPRLGRRPSPPGSRA